jgi:threonine/homoserine efflux transporter RhtA
VLVALLRRAALGDRFSVIRISATYGILVTLEPAVSALVARSFSAGDRPGMWIAVACVTIAAMGSRSPTSRR